MEIKTNVTSFPDGDVLEETIKISKSSPYNSEEEQLLLRVTEQLMKDKFLED